MNELRENVFSSERPVFFLLLSSGKPQAPAEPPYSGHGDTSSAFLKAEVIPAAGWQGGHKKAAVWKALEQEEEICWEAQHLAQLPGRLSLMVSNNSCKTS